MWHNNIILVKATRPVTDINKLDNYQLGCIKGPTPALGIPQKTKYTHTTKLNLLKYIAS